MKIRNCDLCGTLVSKRIKIENRLNGNELNICIKCMKEIGFKEKQSGGTEVGKYH